MPVLSPSDDNDTPLEDVRLCDWHLRRVFRDSQLLRRFQQGELAVIWGTIHERLKPSSAAQARYNQEFILTDPLNGNTQVARCHWFLDEDKTTVLASGLPDPKEIILNGTFYHGNGKRQCDHCAKGISTYSDPIPEA